MQDATHGNSLSHRAHWFDRSMSNTRSCFKGKKMSGHMGAERVTTQNLN